MNRKGGFDKRRTPQQDESQAKDSKEPQIAPGKVTRSSQLPPMRTPPQASVQQKSDPMDEAARRERAALTARWMDTAIRPDLCPPPVQRKRSDTEEPPGSSQPSGSRGQAMPEDVQAQMERAFDADFSAVRIHKGPEAASIGALAFTQGTDIHFAPGQYEPGSQPGQELLGHELAHVVQQAQGRVPGAAQAKGAAGAPVHDDPALEREADVLGARAARGLRATGAAASTGMDRTSQAPALMHTSSSSSIQAKPADEKPLWENAEKDAAALLEAFQGLGTTEQVVYRVLSQPPEVVKAILRIYNARYNRHTGQGLVEDLRAEFDELGGQADWHFVIGQLTRAGISVPDAALRYERQDPAAEADHQGGARIVPTPNVRVAVPGTRITYALAHGTQGLHSLSSPYRYQWYVLNDPVTARMYGKPARVERGYGPQAEATARFVGNHRVICKVTPRTGRGAGVPTFYEFPQTVVPEGTLAQDALKQAPAAVDPARQLAVLERFLEVLRDAERQPGSAPLDPKTAGAYEQQIAALRKRLASTEGAERIPIRAVHVDREKARVSPLRAFVARTQGGEPGEQETWRLVDLTNPESRRLSGEYEGTGKDARAAIFAALAAWDEGNRYPTGRIQLEVGAEAAGAPIAHCFQTDGMSFWDSISEFFAEVGFWTGMGALAAGVVTAVAPVPGMRIVSGLVWASILASSASAVINITQRHAEGMSSTREDAMDVLTIAGNVLAGTWMRGARVLVNGQGGTKIGTGLLIGQLGTDGAQGIVLGLEYLEQYDRVMAIDDPKQRTDALLELLRSAALAGGMLFLSVQGTKSDLGRLGEPGGQGESGRLGSLGEGSELDAPATGPNRTGHAAESESASRSLETSLGRLRDRGIDDAQIERLAAALREAGLEARLLPRLSDDTLVRLADPGVLGELEQVARLQRSGRIIGLDEWIEFGSTKDARDLGRVVGELREARRLVTENPGAVVNVGGDARAPLYPGTDDRMASFDVTVEKPVGTVRRSVEVTTVDDPVSQPYNLKKAIDHATGKVLKRQKAGEPIPGRRDATIRINLNKHRPLGRAGYLTIDETGNIVHQTPKGKSITKGNLFDNVAEYLPDVPGHQHLDHIILVDSTSGAVLAEFARTDTVWTRMR